LFDIGLGERDAFALELQDREGRLVPVNKNICASFDPRICGAIGFNRSAPKLERELGLVPDRICGQPGKRRAYDAMNFSFEVSLGRRLRQSCRGH
jgi:hypothetical protein